MTKPAVLGLCCFFFTSGTFASLGLAYSELFWYQWGEKKPDKLLVIAW
jgi:hypothetical protein